MNQSKPVWIGAFQKFSLIDYTGEVCSIIFTLGCNFRCPYCHNPELVYSTIEPIDENKIIEFLKTRKGKLTAVSITGGEPTLHRNLPDFIDTIKSMGFKVKLDTNGTNPGMLKYLVEKRVLDYLAMDIKAPLERYKDVVCAEIDIDKIKKSIEIIMKSKVDYEFRTTVVKNFITKEDIKNIAKLIEGSKLYCIQNFMPSKTLDAAFKTKSGYLENELKELRQTAQKYVKKCIMR